RADYVEMVTEAIARRDASLLRALVGELHESDTGDLIEALDPELRPRLIELMGKDFDFTALTEVDDTVREEILEELPTETVAEGVRDLDSDDAVAILEDLPDRFYELYVVDKFQRLKGAVALDRLLRTKRPVPIDELTNEEL